MLLGGEVVELALELRGDGVAGFRLKLGHGEVQGLIGFVGGGQEYVRWLLE